MPDLHQNQHPAILIPGFDISPACLSMASRLIACGYPVIAVCKPGDEPVKAAAIDAGCIAVEADRASALRAGLAYFSREMETLPGVVMSEPEDGYSADDVLRMAEALEANQGKLIIASRYRNNSLGVLANLERWLGFMAFTLVHGRKISDPWASLRALPSRLVEGFLELKGEGRRFEFNMLLNLHHRGVRAISVPVSAEYSFSKGSGLWDRAVDIFRIMLLPLKFVSSSLVATLADNTVFLLMNEVLLRDHWIIAVTACRSTGALIGYLLNRNVVFKQKNNTWRKEAASAIKFILLAGFNYGASLLLINFFNTNLHIDHFISKLMSDILLFATSFLVQRDLIFRRNITTGK